jgi:hypothetical protein
MEHGQSDSNKRNGTKKKSNLISPQSINLKNAKCAVYNKHIYGIMLCLTCAQACLIW